MYSLYIIYSPLKLTNIQSAAILGTVLLIVQLLFLGNTTPNKKKGQEVTTEDVLENTLSEEILLAEARTKLDSAQITWLADLDKEKAQAEDILQEAEVLKLISRTWYEYKNYLLSAYYAKKAAELLQTAEAWAIAGTTYDIAYRQSEKTTEKKLAVREAIAALQEAKRIEPDTLQHAINEALMYVELSTVDASVIPMKGILMLRDLENKHENNVKINMTLGRMSATRTKDMAKAKPRFEKVILIAEKEYVPLHIVAEAYYYLIEYHKSENNKEEAIKLYDKVIALSVDNPTINQSFVTGKQKYLNPSN